MSSTSRKLFRLIAIALIGNVALLLAPAAHSQTLGGITGTVTDTSGGAIVESQVTLLADALRPVLLDGGRTVEHAHVFPRRL